MNIFKWFICWFNKTHVFAMFLFDKNGKEKYKCIRCGIEKYKVSK